MSGLFGGGGNSGAVDTSAPIVSSFRVQTSAYGRPIPLVWGLARVAANLIDYDDFTAIPHTESSGGGGGGGKGGGGGGGGSTNTTYTYTTAVIMGLCEGQVFDIPNAWVDKSYTKPGSLNLSTYDGRYSQVPFGYWTTYHPQKALGYRGVAYVASGSYDLGESASMPNHNFEVDSTFAFSATIRDANPKDVIVDFLTNANYGVGYASGRIGDLTALSNYCVANGVFVSPAWTEQKAASDYLTTLAQIANCGMFYSESLLKFVPYSDMGANGNGVTFTPNATAVYALTDDDFLSEGDNDPVTVTRADPADAYNQVQVKFYNRANAYNEEIAEAKDQASIEFYGLRPMQPVELHEICDPAIAQLVAQLLLQRVISVRNTYTFKLGWKYCRLEPMDLLTLTESQSDNGLSNVPVRITGVEEDENGDLTITAEDYPAGVSAAVQYPRQGGSGYAANFNGAPGNVNAPAFIEAPVVLTTSGLELWAAVSGVSTFWGGAEIWVSESGSTYRRVGVVHGNARHGTLRAALPLVADPDTTSTLQVDIAASHGQLLGGTQQDADNNNTLCYADGEFISYRDSTLVATGKYNLGYLRRGQYNTPIGAHAAGTIFARLDDAVFKFPYTSDRVGTSIFVKFISFNIYGGAAQNLSDVQAYQYTFKGTALLTPLANVSALTSRFVGGNTVIAWTGITDFRTVDYEVRLGSSAAAGVVLGRVPTTEFRGVGDGTYWVAAHYLTPDGTDVYSTAWQSISISGSVLVANVVASWDEAAAGWGGTLTPYAIKVGANLQLDAVNNFLGLADMLGTASILWNGGIGQTGGYQIPAGHRINVGRPVACGINIVYAISGQSIFDNALALADFLGVTDFLGAALGAKVSATPQIRIAQGGGVYGAWQNYTPGDYVGQYFDAQILLASSDPQVTPILSAFKFAVDVPDRVESQSGVAVAAGGMTVTYSPAFNGGPNSQVKPNLQITILSAVQGDDAVVTADSVAGFTVQIFNAGVGVARNINWISQGY
jgi:hypothetical protein